MAARVATKRLDRDGASWLVRAVLIRRLPQTLFATLCLTTAVFAARGDDRPEAEALIREVTASPESASVAAQPIERAKDALRRSSEARGGGDSAHSALLDSLGLEWAQTARDLHRAVRAERQLAEVQKQVGDTEQKLTRAKALLDDTVARRGRAQHKLKTLEKPRGGAK